MARGMVERGASVTFLCDLQPDRLEKSWQFLSEVQKAKPRVIKDTYRQGYEISDMV